MSITPETILELWFSPRVRPLWFNSTLAFDEELRAGFMDIYRQALAGTLDRWAHTPEGALALVIVLDQFALNMFRGLPESYTGEATARRIAGEVIASGYDQALGPEQKAFLYMPFMHSETLADQDRAVALYERAGLNDNLKWARHHRELIRRFGRFPHRNAVLGRQSTVEERTYLASKEAFVG